MPELATPVHLTSPMHWVPVGTVLARPMTLLLVEDSRHAAEAVRLLARRLSMRLRRADSLSSARRHLRVYRPDVALIDLGLPDGSGLDLIAELAAGSPRLRRIVAVSADPDAGPAALAAGAQAFVAKPVRIPQDLAALLGPGAPVLAEHGPGTGEGGRNAGADPLALRDDLLRMQAVLDQDAPRGLDYAVGFLQGLARCTGDAGLGEQARRAAISRDALPLVAALTARTTARAGI